MRKAMSPAAKEMKGGRNPNADIKNTTDFRRDFALEPSCNEMRYKHLNMKTLDIGVL